MQATCRAWVGGLKVLIRGLVVPLSLSAAEPDVNLAAESGLSVAGGSHRTDDLFRLTGTQREVAIVEWDRPGVQRASLANDAFVIRSFPISADRAVALKLEAFSVMSESTRVVIGRRDGPDLAVAYDASGFSLFRGEVVGGTGSSVFIALGERGSTGFVDLGTGQGRYRIASKDATGMELPAGSLSVFPASASVAGVQPPGVAYCAADEVSSLKAVTQAAEAGRKVPLSQAASAAASTVGVKHMELAVDTDYDYFSLFGDVAAATDYVHLAYGEVSTIFQRDVNVHIEVVFVRIWTDPDDLFNGGDPLSEFYFEWDANMGGVPRDAAQLFSGRRDFPFGGQAFLSQLCGNFGYGVTGYILGFFPDPTRPSPYTWDVSVTAHELGHTFGAPHTHAGGVDLDTCDNPNTTPRRGSIMSYCGQTWSGMNANQDNYFHTVIRGFINSHVNESSCVVPDCNLNNVHDFTDIGGATSADANGNLIPDECEDCNTNGTLDPADIAGASDDENLNGIPDECEPDCNGNGTPDDKDIASGTSSDLYGNGIPDECETDCNSNGVSDYTEIQADMPLDVDRNAVLDSCQDCNADGTTDLVELENAHFAWVASGLSGSILRAFHPVGVLSDSTPAFPAAQINGGQDVVIRADGHVLVTSAADDRVVEFDGDGSYVGDLLGSGAGGLDHPTGMLISKTGTLLVSSMLTDSVLEFNATTGAALGAFVSGGSGGLVEPFGLAYGPNGNLFVASGSGEVLEYDSGTGAFLGVFVRAAENGGLDQPRGIAFKPDGNLLVASYGTDEVLEFDGRLGRPLGKWAQVGTADRITQDSPWGIRIGPDRNVYVSRTGSGFSSGTAGDASDGVGFSHLTDARMFEYDVCTGWFRRTLIGGNDHGLQFATGFAFVAGGAKDCNYNWLQDDCDIASGFSADANGNGVPDECEVDCDGNGTYDAEEFFPFGDKLDCNCNGQLDGCDVSQAVSLDCNENGVPDECEDCDGDGVADECEIAGGAADCNANGLPDSCESSADCDGNGTADICDLAAGAADCNGNGVIDTCDVAPGQTLYEADFESGLPPGWTTSGVFDPTTSCVVSPICDGSRWMHAGNSASCTYGNSESGVLTAPVVYIPPGQVTLRFCSMVDTELDFDFVDVYANDTLVWRKSGEIRAWEEEVVDLTPFANESVALEFRFASDAFVSGTIGWEVDRVVLEVVPTSEDCDGNGAPDECQPDSDGDGTIDACQVPPSVVAPLEEEDYQRVISFVVPVEGSGQETALRVLLDSLYHPGEPLPVDPPDFSLPEGEVRYVNRLLDEQGEPVTTCPDSASFGTVYRCATLGCEPEYYDWAGALAGKTLRVGGTGIVPDSSYRVEQLAANCAGNETACATVSAALVTGTTRYGDADSDGTTDVSDIVATVDRVKDIAGAPPAYACYVRSQAPQPQLESPNVTDVVLHVDALKLFAYPLDVPSCP